MPKTTKASSTSPTVTSDTGNSTSIDDNADNNDGLGSAGLIGIAVGAVVGVALVSLIVLKQRRIISIRLPLIDSVLNRSSGFDDSSLMTTSGKGGMKSFSKYQRHNESISLQNPAFQ
jgi:hypothetical protein